MRVFNTDPPFFSPLTKYLLKQRRKLILRHSKGTSSLIEIQSNSRCVVAVFREHEMHPISRGRFYRKPLPSRDTGDVKHREQAVGINTLSK